MITAEKVDEIFRSCLFKNDEPHENPVIAEGITNNFGFHPERLKDHTNEISEMLKDFPDEFYEGKGGGWTFLNFCMTKNGTQWGEHVNMEQLIVLGIAIEKVAYTLPRDMWSILPGGMPYIVIKNI